MRCDHPECTGDHHTTNAGACPRRKAEHADGQYRYRGTAKGMLADVRHHANERGAR